MAKPGARLTKVTLRKIPAFFLCVSSLRMQVKGSEKSRRSHGPETIIIFGIVVDPLTPGDELFGRTSHGEPTVSQTRHTPQGVVVVAGSNPYWNRPSNRFRLDAQLFKLKVLSGKRESAFGP